jgi:hypothetical protein
MYDQLDLDVISKFLKEMERTHIFYEFFVEKLYYDK